MGGCAHFSMLSLPHLTVGLAVTSKRFLCSLTACLRNMLIAWVVLMPSSEKSLAASSLVCLSVRTVTFTVSEPPSLPYTCFMRPLHVRRAGFPGFPSCHDGNPLYGDWDAP